ncbi:hypothetical protein CMUS01_13380 [Colletotrichum musicola]|uniref:Uncharacterized protein n=1 Tax=Colletotrichum musicola TaxID=2175873 RepID=A0A8H6JE69_9PEZI|nr:hypothetical protein CMUS01_13380 [Colletotrichum musicola]
MKPPDGLASRPAEREIDDATWARVPGLRSVARQGGSGGSTAATVPGSQQRRSHSLGQGFLQAASCKLLDAPCSMLDQTTVLRPESDAVVPADEPVLPSSHSGRRFLLIE